MTFTESIKTCLSKYASFDGRASRPEYWWWALFMFLLQAATGMVSQNLQGIVSLGFLLPSLAVGARRLHDTDRSGWFLLLSFIPIVGWIILLIFLIQEGKEPNRFSTPA